MANHTSKTTTFFIFHLLQNTKILRENHVYLLFHWFSGENCITFTFSSHKGWQINFSDVFTYRFNLKNFASLFFLIQDNFMF